ncbi:MAG TPA: hypothetical protein PLS66_12350 [Tepiditoga sp.]|nr:hypothetical protein [Thermotogota bacterium]HOO76078.1 hypothetical protein [Tepiditoga sp.]
MDLFNVVSEGNFIYLKKEGDLKKDNIYDIMEYLRDFSETVGTRKNIIIDFENSRFLDFTLTEIYGEILNIFRKKGILKVGIKKPMVNDSLDGVT